MLFKSGALTTIVPLETSPFLKRGETSNKIKIIAIGSKFDFYINDKFVIAFEEESIRKGGIGIYVGQHAYILIDNLRIWKIKR